MSTVGLTTANLIGCLLGRNERTASLRDKIGRFAGQLPNMEAGPLFCSRAGEGCCGKRGLTYISEF